MGVGNRKMPAQKKSKKLRSRHRRKTHRRRNRTQKTRRSRGGRAVPPTNNRHNNLVHLVNINNNANASANNLFATQYTMIEQEWLDLYAHLDHNEIIDVRGFMQPRFYDWQTQGGELDLSFQPEDLPDTDESNHQRVRDFFTLLSSQEDDIIQEFIENEFAN
jgi:hypothetical protein